MLVTSLKVTNVSISMNVVTSLTIVILALFASIWLQIIAALVKKATKVQASRSVFVLWLISCESYMEWIEETFSGDGFYCTIIDHCKSNPCPLTAVCSSALDGFTCTCHEGYDTKETMDKDGNMVFEDCEKIPDQIVKKPYTDEIERKKTYNG